MSIFVFSLYENEDFCLFKTLFFNHINTLHDRIICYQTNIQPVTQFQLPPFPVNSTNRHSHIADPITQHTNTQTAIANLLFVKDKLQNKATTVLQHSLYRKRVCLRTTLRHVSQPTPGTTRNPSFPPLSPKRNAYLHLPEGRWERVM